MPGTGSVRFLVARNLAKQGQWDFWWPEMGPVRLMVGSVRGLVAWNKVSGISGGQKLDKTRSIGFLVARNGASLIHGGVSGTSGGLEQGHWDFWWPEIQQTRVGGISSGQKWGLPDLWWGPGQWDFLFACLFACLLAGLLVCLVVPLLVPFSCSVGACLVCSVVVWFHVFACSRWCMFVGPRVSALPQWEPN